jgi:hypothetical protein
MTSKEWIDKKIENGNIKYFEYSNFRNIEVIGKGAFGVVNKAYLGGGIKVALKSPLDNNENQEENFLKEVSYVN